MNDKGCSTCKERGQFKYEVFESAALRSIRVQWDYRDATGILHSGITKSVEDAVKEAEKYGYTQGGDNDTE